MPNAIPCGECSRYWEIKKPLKNGKGYIRLRRGHCLAKTIYAKNRPGSPVYPPGATVEELPDCRHKIYLVREEHVECGCTQVKEK